MEKPWIFLNSRKCKPATGAAVVYKTNQCKNCSLLNNNNNNTTSPNWNWGRTSNIVFLLMWGWKHWLSSELAMTTSALGSHWAEIAGRCDFGIHMPTFKNFPPFSYQNIELALLGCHKLITDTQYLKTCGLASYGDCLLMLWFLKVQHLSRLFNKCSEMCVMLEKYQSSRLLL